MLGVDIEPDVKMALTNITLKDCLLEDNRGGGLAVCLACYSRGQDWLNAVGPIGINLMNLTIRGGGLTFSEIFPGSDGAINVTGGSIRDAAGSGLVVSSKAVDSARVSIRDLVIENVSTQTDAECCPPSGKGVNPGQRSVPVSLLWRPDHPEDNFFQYGSFHLDNLTVRDERPRPWLQALSSSIHSWQQVSGAVTVANPHGCREEVQNASSSIASDVRVTCLKTDEAFPVDSTVTLQRLIDAAIDEGKALRLPASATDLHISAPLNLSRGNILITGPVSGVARIVQLNSSLPIFAAEGRRGQDNTTIFVRNITIRRLHFAGSSGGYAVAASAASDLTVENCSAVTVGLVDLRTVYPINRWDKSKDPAATAGLTSASQLSQRVTVVGNTLRGGGSKSVGVSLQYVQGANVSGNNVSGYNHGLMWDGGDANPGRGGAPDNPRWARDLVFTNNTVLNSSNGGIWGGMGQGVVVSGNVVDGCGDVCLDAEGSNDVNFTDNVASNARSGVLTVFFNSQHVRFERNTVVQDGTHHPEWKRLLRTCNPTDVGAANKIAVTLANNHFRYTNATGLGLLLKDAGMVFRFVNNTLENCVLSFNVNYISDMTESIFIEDNTLSFSRLVSAAPVSTMPLGATTTAPISTGGATVSVRGNTLVSTIAQPYTAGIEVSQTGYGGGWPRTNGPNGRTVASVIAANAVKSFATSISFVGNATNTHAVFPASIRGNTVSGSIVDRSPRGRDILSASANRDWDGKAVQVQRFKTR